MRASSASWLACAAPARGGALGVLAIVLALATLAPGAVLAQAPPVPPDLWLTLHGDPQEPDKNLIEVRPEPIGLDQRVVLDLRVSRDQVRTSFRGLKYRSYYAKAVINCTSQTAWYLWLQYHAQPGWAGPVIGREDYTEGQAALLFKDVPGEPYKRMIAAACRVRGG